TYFSPAGLFHTFEALEGLKIDTELSCIGHRVYISTCLYKPPASIFCPQIGAKPSDLDSLFDNEFDKCVGRFAADTGGVIYVVQPKEEGEATTQTLHLTYHPLRPQGLNHQHLTQQCHWRNFPNLFGGDEMLYERLYAVVSHGVKTWFDAFIGTRGTGKDGDTKMGILVAMKKSAEPKLSLLHLQQNVETPEPYLIIHPTIQRAAHIASTTPNIFHIPAELLNDSTFFTITSTNGSISKSTRDVSSGTASQEINFWLSLQRALEAIEARLRNDHVNMVMDCLRNAKRCFIADTGLKDATDQGVNCSLAFDSAQIQPPDGRPLNELLSAMDFDRVQESLELTFGHIHRKLGLLPYPICRRSHLVGFQRPAPTHSHLAPITLPAIRHL
ncbi:hypothetical protein CVT26_013218, partial [Gymnopilus dilepis]